MFSYKRTSSFLVAVVVVVLFCLTSSISKFAEACDFFAGNWGGSKTCEDRLCSGACEKFTDTPQNSNTVHWMSLESTADTANYATATPFDPLQQIMDVWAERGDGWGGEDYITQSGYYCEYHQSQKDSPMPCQMIRWNTTQYAEFKNFGWCMWVRGVFLNAPTFNTNADTWDDGSTTFDPGQTTRYPWNNLDCRTHGFTCPAETCSSPTNGITTANCASGTNSICQEGWRVRKGKVSNQKNRKSCQRLSPILNWTRRYDFSPFEDLFVPSRMNRLSARSWCNQFTVGGADPTAGGALGDLTPLAEANSPWMYEQVFKKDMLGKKYASYAYAYLNDMMWLGMKRAQNNNAKAEIPKPWNDGALKKFPYIQTEHPDVDSNSYGKKCDITRTGTDTGDNGMCMTAYDNGIGVRGSDTVQWLMFWCTRNVIPISFAATYQGQTWSCYQQRWCTVKIVLPVTFTRQFSAELIYALTATGPAFNSATGTKTGTATFVVGVTSIGPDLQSYYPGIAEISANITNARGFGFDNGTDAFEILALNNVTINGETHMTTATTWFTGQTVTFTAEDTSGIAAGTVQPITSSCCTSCACIQWDGTPSFSSTGAGTYSLSWTILSTMTPDDNAVLRFTVSDYARYHQNSMVYYSYKILAPATITTSNTPATLRAGTSYVLTVQVNTADPILGSGGVVTVTPTSTCTGLTFTPTDVTFNGGDSNPAATITVAADAAMSSSTCPITFAHTSGLPQFPTAITSESTVVQGLLTHSITTWTASMRCNEAVTFVVTLSAFLSTGTVTVTPTTTAKSPGSVVVTFSPTSADFSTTVKELSFTVSAACSNSFTATVSYTLSGASTGEVTTTLDSKDGSWTNLQVIQASMPTSLYVGNTGILKLGDGGKIQGADTIAITWTFSDSTMLNVTTGSVTLTAASNVSYIYLGAVGANTGTMSFSATVPAYFDNNMPDLSLTVNPLKTFTVTPAVAQANLSIGYSFTVSLAVSAKPAASGDSVTFTPIFDSTYISVSPASGTWANSDATNDPKVFTITGVAEHAATSLKFTLSGNAPDFNMSDSSDLGTIRVYRRATVNTTVDNITLYDVPGSTAAIPFTMSKTLPFDFIITVTLPVLYVSGPTSFTFTAATTSQSITAAKLAIGTGTATFALSSSNADWMNKEAESYIEPVAVYMLAARQMNFTCNDTQLYFGSGWVLKCTATIPEFPSTGTMGVSVSSPTAGVFQFGLAPNAAPTTPLAGSFSASVLSIDFYAFPIFSPLAITDGDPYDIKAQVVDTSYSFNPADTLVPIAARQLQTITLSLLTSVDIYVGSTFEIEAVSSAIPDTAEPLTLTCAPAGLTFSNATLNVYNDSTGSPMKVRVNVTTSTPATYTLKFGVAGSSKFDIFSLTVDVLVRSLATVTLSPAAADITTLFNGQDTTITLSSIVPLAGTDITFTPIYYCNGVASPDTVIFSPTNATWTSTSTPSSPFQVNATGTVCPSGGEIYWQRTGSSAIYAANDNSTFNTRELVAVRAPATNYIVYGGLLNTTTINLQVDALPFATGGDLHVDVANNDTALFTLTPTSADYAQGNDDYTRFVALTGKAESVTEPQYVEFSLTLSGSSASEFYLVESVIIIKVLPIVNVSVHDTLLTDPIIFVGGQFARMVTISLPQPPEGTGSVTVTPVFNNGATSAVQFTPTSFVLDRNTQSLDVNVTALAATSGSEAISFTYSGTASEYFPQLDSQLYPVTFWARGTFTVGNIPASLFNTLSDTLSIIVSYAPPAGYPDVSLAVTPTDPAITVSPASVSWTTGDTVLEQAITLSGAAVHAGVLVNFVITGPNIYLPVPNPASATISVLDSAAVIFNMPSFIYVNGIAVTGSVIIVILPQAGKQLDVIPAVSGTLQPLTFVPSTTSFTPSTNKQLPISITATVASPPVTVSINLLGSAGLDNDYDAPPDMTVEIRSLETMIVSGLPTELYVGGSATVTVTFSRLPIKTNTFIEITPAFGSADAAFFPSSQKWLSDGSTPLAQSFTFTTASATLSPVAVTWTVSGTNTEIFESNVQSSVTHVMIYDKERVSVFTADNLTDGSGGFTYQDNRLPLNVSLGLPKMPHSGVSVVLGYAGRAGSALFEPATITFAAGTNWQIVQMYAVLTSDPALLTATVTVAAAVFVPNAMPTVRLLSQIPVTLSFNPAAQLIVVGRVTTLSVGVADPPGAALAGDLIVTLTYGTGAEIGFSGAITFLAKDAQLNKNIVLTGLVATALQNVTMTFSGPGAGFYSSTQYGFPTPVYPQKEVRFTSFPQPQEVYIGSMNKEVIVFNLSALPTVPSDQIIVTLTESTNFGFNRSGGDPVGQAKVILTQSMSTGAVEIEGFLPGTVTLSNFVTVQALPSQEYMDNIGIAAPLTASTILIRVRLTVSCTNFVSNFFTDQQRTFNFTLPQVPAKGVLTLLPRLAGGLAYPIQYSPSTLVFSNAPGSQRWAILNVTAGSGVLNGATFELSATGSTDYLDIPFSAPLNVIDGTLVVVSGVPVFMYPGAINTVPVTVSISKPPDGNMTVLLAPTPGSYLAFTPDTIFYNGSTPLDQQVSLRATNYQPEPANFSLTLTEYPTPYFQPSTTPSVQIRAPDTVTATLSTYIVYQGQPLTITIDLSSAPTDDLILDLVLRKNQTGTGKTMLDLIMPDEVTVPQSQLNLFGQTSATFTATAEFSPLSVEVSFLISGGAAKTFQPQELLPRFVIQFAPLRKIFVFAPQYMYVGLVANVTVEVEKLPDDAGSQLKIQGIPDMMLGLTSSQAFIWNTASSQTMMQFNPPCVPDATGLANIYFSVSMTATVAYETSVRDKALGDQAQVAGLKITVKNPTVIGLGALPPNVFFGPLNSFQLPVTITGDALTADDDITVILKTNDTNIVMVPSTGVLQMPSTAGIFTIYSTVPTYAYFNLSFMTKLNRFILDPAAELVPVHFRPLKPIFIIPPFNEYIVLQPVPYTVDLNEKPEPGHTLVAELIYSGSPGNVNLPASVGWTSATSSLQRILTAFGTSTTGVQLLSVKFSGDPQYNLTQFDWSMKFNPLLNLGHNFPTSAFYNRTVANLTMTTEKAMNVTISFSTSPVNVIVFDPPQMTWLPSDTALTKPLNFRPIDIPSAPVTIKFALSGPDASKFNAIPDFQVSIVGADAILIIAPSSSMTVYLKPGMTVQIGVMISEPARGDLYVTPSWSGCPAGFANFTYTPLHFTPTSPQVLYTEIFGVFARANCALQFPLSGVTQPFVGTSNLYSVTVRPLYVISLELPSKRVFRGAANKVPIFIHMDADLGKPSDKSTMVPPEEAIIVNFWTIEPCLSLNPTTLTWAKGSTTESLVKEVYVTADVDAAGWCPRMNGPGTELIINVNVTTLSDIYNITVPYFVMVNALELLVVTASEVSGTVNNFFMWVGDTPLTFDVVLPELLEPNTEGLEVKPLFGGIAGSVSALSALWPPSPNPKLSQFAIISAITISTEAKLDFEVIGPPRFERWASGNGTLEIFGPLSVVADVPEFFIASRNYTIEVTVQDRPLPGVEITVTPVWIGAPTALLFDPPFLTWDFNSPFTKSLTIAALQPSGAYRLRFVVAGSRRFVESAFDGLVPIKAPQVIAHRALPQQLMMGQSYTLLVNIGEMPVGTDELLVTIQPQTQFLLPCIAVSPSTLTYTNNVAVPNVELPVSVTVKSICDTKMLDINFVVHGNASYMYNRTVITRKFQTVAWSPLSISWTSQSYIGENNKPELLLTLNQKPTYPDNVTIVLEQIHNTPNVTNITFTKQVVWDDTTAKEQYLTLFGRSAGNATIRFSVLHAPAGFNYPTTEYTVEFFPLIQIGRTKIPASFYQNDKNKVLVTLNLSAPVRTLQNQMPVQFILTPSSRDKRVIFQPAQLTWSPEQNPIAIMYITGIIPGLENITFSFSGSAQHLVTNTLPYAETEILELILIEFTPQQPILYVGTVNEQTVSLLAPPTNAPLRVSVEVDGEANALQVSPAVVEWFQWTPREQKVTMTGMYGSPVQCLLRYRMLLGPSNIDVRDSRGHQMTTVTALRPVTRTPDTVSFLEPERTEIVLSFSPTMPVDCTFVPNITEAITIDSTSHPLYAPDAIDPYNNRDVNTTIMILRYYGRSIGSCVPRDPTYAALDDFIVDAIPLKRFNIRPRIANTFINTTIAVKVSISASPEGGTMTMRPNMSGAIFSVPQNKTVLEDLSQYFTPKPSIILFTSTSKLTERYVFKGNNLTNGPKLMNQILSGPIGEYLTESVGPDGKPISMGAVQFWVDVREPIVLNTWESDLMNETRTGANEYYSYINEENGANWFFEITGVPLTGSIVVTMSSTNADVIFAPAKLIFPINTALTQLQVKIWSKSPVSNAGISITVAGPQEYVGVTKKSLGTISFLALESITGMDTLPSVMYLGKANEKKLGVQLTGFPRPRQIVAVLATTECGVTISIPVIEWSHGSDATQLTRSFAVEGKESVATPCKITLTWLVRPNKIPATNFITDVNKGVKTVIVKPIITMAVLIPSFIAAKPVPGSAPDGPNVFQSEFTIFNSKANGRTITITMADIPADISREAVVNVWFECNEKVNGLDCPKDIFQLSTTKLTFGQTQKNGAKSQTIDVHANSGSSGNATLVFQMAGTSATEFNGGQKITTVVVVEELLTFQVLDLRRKFAMGIENRIKFLVKPSRKATLTTTVIMTCPEITVSPAQLVWGEDNTPQEVELYSAGAATDAESCAVTIRTSGGVSKKAFIGMVVNELVQAVPRPEVVPWHRTIPYTDIKSGVTLNIQLTGEGFYQYRTPIERYQKTVIGSKVNSTVYASSTATSTESGILGKIADPNAKFIKFMDGSDSTNINIVLGPDVKFSLPRGETITWTVQRNALQLGEAFKRKKDFVKLTVTGQAEELAAAGNVIANGVSGALVAMAAMSLHTSLFAGRVLSAMSMVQCPDLEWRQEQNEMGWYRQLIPVAFGSNDDLGTYAAVGFTTILALVGVVVLHMGLAWLVFQYRLRGTAWDKSFGAALALMRFPSFDFFPALFYYQIVVSSSLRVIMYSPNVALRFVAAFSFLSLGFGAPIAIMLRVKPGFRARWYTSESQFMADVKKLEQEQIAKTGGNTAVIADDSDKPLLDDKKTSADDDDVAAEQAAKAEAEEEENNKKEQRSGIMKFIAAVGFWRNPEDIYWVPRYGMLFDKYTEKYKTWLVGETIFSFLLGVIDGIAPDSVGFCKAKAILMIMLYLFLFLIMMALRPFTRPWFNGLFSFTYFLMFLTMALLGDAIMKNDPRSPMIESGMTVLTFHSFLLIFKAAIDFIMGMMDFFGVMSLLKTRVTGRIDQAKNERTVSDDTEEMKTQMARDDFTRLMNEHAVNQALVHGVAEKRAEEERRTKEHARQVVHAEAEMNPFNQQSSKRKEVEYNDDDMDFI